MFFNIDAKFLIVDDQPHSLMGLALMLETIGIPKVIACDDSTKVKNIVQYNDINLILLQEEQLKTAAYQALAHEGPPKMNISFVKRLREVGVERTEVFFEYITGDGGLQSILNTVKSSPPLHTLLS